MASETGKESRRGQMVRSMRVTGETGKLMDTAGWPMLTEIYTRGIGSMTSNKV